ncbi:unnamed protein product [Durusdinium trenchii]|uniref:PPM-type phosphatase domain-containing protein n=1 Tax=Durusdinium trenchii TaxID=1381693 RepID=A0ABP0N4B8_9DINO
MRSTAEGNFFAVYDGHAGRSCKLGQSSELPKLLGQTSADVCHLPQGGSVSPSVRRHRGAVQLLVLSPRFVCEMTGEPGEPGDLAPSRASQFIGNVQQVWRSPRKEDCQVNAISH